MSDSQRMPPFVGLRSFTENDADYFFGRENDIRIIGSNLKVHRLTLLFGESGVGKSSVLCAGVVPALRQEAQGAYFSAVEFAESLARSSRETQEDPSEPKVSERSSTTRECRDAHADRQPVGVQDRPDERLASGDTANSPMGAMPRWNHAVVLFDAWQDENPLGKLGAAVADELGRLGIELDAVAGDVPTADVDHLRKWSKPLVDGLLIILDQFEEYFTYQPKHDPKWRFAEELGAALRDSLLPVHFLITMRSDTISKLDQLRELVPGLYANRLQVQALDHGQASRAIVEPIRIWYKKEGRAPVLPDRELVDEILSSTGVEQQYLQNSGRAGVEAENTVSGDIAQTRHGAPYIQLVMQRLWEYAHSQTGERAEVIDIVCLRSLGSVRGIARTHVDNALKGLKRKEQAAWARMSTYLVTPGGTKYAHGREFLEKMANPADRRGSPVDVSQILFHLVSREHRVLRPVAPTDSGEQRYQLAHDVLAAPILAWRAEFEARERLRHKWKRFDITVAVIALVFAIASGILVYKDIKEDEVTAAQHGKALAEARSQAAEEREAHQRLLGQIANGRTLAQIVINNREQPVERDLLLALQAQRMVATLPGEGSGQAIDQAFRAALGAPYYSIALRADRGPITALSWAPPVEEDAPLRVAVGHQSGTIVLWESLPGSRWSRTEVHAHHGAVTDLDHAPDGTLFSCGQDGWLCHWSGDLDVIDREQSPGTVFTGISASADARYVATSEEQGIVRIWDAATLWPKEALLRAHYPEVVTDIAFGPNGDALAWTTDYGRLLLWQRLDRQTNPGVWFTHIRGADRVPLTAMCFSSDGDWITVGDNTGSVIHVSTKEQGAAHQLSEEGSGRRVDALSRDAWGHLVSAPGRQGAVGEVLLWVDPDIDLKPARLVRHEGSVGVAQLGPGGLLATGDDRGVLRIWNLEPEDGAEIVTSNRSVQALTVTGEETVLFTAWDDGALEALEPDPGPRSANGSERIVMPSDHEFTAYALSPSGAFYAVAHTPYGVTLWDLGSGDALELETPGCSAKALAFSQDERFLVAGGHGAELRSGCVLVWDCHSLGEPLVRYETEVEIASVALLTGSGDPGVVAGSTEGAVWLWETSAGSTGSEALYGHVGRVSALTYDPQSKRFVSGGYDGVTTLWQIDSPAPLVALQPSGSSSPVTAIACAGGTRTLAIGHEDGSVRLWDAQSPGEPKGVLCGHEHAVRAMAFGPDGRWLYTGSADGTVRRWHVPEDDLIELACRKVTRGFTQYEWDEYVGGDEVPQPACLDAMEAGPHLVIDVDGMRLGHGATLPLTREPEEPVSHWFTAQLVDANDRFVDCGDARFMWRFESGETRGQPSGANHERLEYLPPDGITSDRVSVSLWLDGTERELAVDLSIGMSAEPLAPATYVPTQTATPTTTERPTHTATPTCTATPSVTPLASPTPSPIPAATRTPVPTPRPSCAGTRRTLDGRFAGSVARAEIDRTMSECELVDSPLQLSGSYQQLPDGAEIWTLVYAHAAGLYYPQSPNACAGLATDLRGGYWQVPVYLGYDGVAPGWYDIVAALGDPEASLALGDYLRAGCSRGGYGGLTPEQLESLGLQEMDAITVYRAAETPRLQTPDDRGSVIRSGDFRWRSRTAPNNSAGCYFVLRIEPFVPEQWNGKTSIDYLVWNDAWAGDREDGAEYWATCNLDAGAGARFRWTVVVAEWKNPGAEQKPPSGKDARREGRAVNRNAYRVINRTVSYREAQVFEHGGGGGGVGATPWPTWPW